MHKRRNTRPGFWKHSQGIVALGSKQFKRENNSPLTHELPFRSSLERQRS